MNDGCVLRTVPRRRMVNHNVNNETASAITDTAGEMSAKAIFILIAAQAATDQSIAAYPFGEESVDGLEGRDYFLY